MNLIKLGGNEIRAQFAGDSRSAADAGILGVRPEDLAISGAAATDGGITLNLTVEAIERVGAETFVYGTRARAEKAVSATPGELPEGEVIVRIPGQDAPAIGASIRATAPRDKLHLFSVDGRNRIDI
jgi:sn-glycerol 3-phosphate transport system ATP-binding protein